MLELVCVCLYDMPQAPVIAWLSWLFLVSVFWQAAPMPGHPDIWHWGCLPEDWCLGNSLAGLWHGWISPQSLHLWCASLNDVHCLCYQTTIIISASVMLPGVSDSFNPLSCVVYSWPVSALTNSASNEEAFQANAALRIRFIVCDIAISWMPCSRILWCLGTWN